MKAQKVIIALALLSFFTQNILGCICGPVPEIDEYDYIALVEITGVLKSDIVQQRNSGGSPQPIYHEVKVKTIEHFYGRKQDYLIIRGGNGRYNLGQTSCDINMQIGQQWVIYGSRFKSKVATGYCSLSTLHMNNKLEIDYKYERSINRLRELRSKMKHKSPKVKSDSIVIKYPNKKIKLREQYDEKEHLDGQRLAYYSNGQIMLNEYYIGGKKNGNLTWYYRNGEIHRISHFKDGKEICETYYYSIRGKLSNINFYDDNGKSIQSR